MRKRRRPAWSGCSPETGSPVCAPSSRVSSVMISPNQDTRQTNRTPRLAHRQSWPSRTLIHISHAKPPEAAHAAMPTRPGEAWRHSYNPAYKHKPYQRHISSTFQAVNACYLPNNKVRVRITDNAHQRCEPAQNERITDHRARRDAPDREAPLLLVTTSRGWRPTGDFCSAGIRFVAQFLHSPDPFYQDDASCFKAFCPADRKKRGHCRFRSIPLRPDPSAIRFTIRDSESGATGANRRDPLSVAAALSACAGHVGTRHIPTKCVRRGSGVIGGRDLGLPRAFRDAY